MSSSIDPRDLTCPDLDRRDLLPIDQRREETCIRRALLKSRERNFPAKSGLVDRSISGLQQHREVKLRLRRRGHLDSMKPSSNDDPSDPRSPHDLSSTTKNEIREASGARSDGALLLHRFNARMLRPQRPMSKRTMSAPNTTTKRTSTTPPREPSAVRRSSRTPCPRKRTVLERGAVVDNQLDDSCTEQACRNGAELRPAKRSKQTSAKQTDKHKVQVITGPVPQINNDEEPTNVIIDAVAPPQNGKHEGETTGQESVSQLNVRVLHCIMRLEREMANLRGFAVSPEKEDNRVGMLVDLLCAVNEAGSDVGMVREKVLEIMKESKDDPPFQRSLFPALRMCLGFTE